MEIQTRALYVYSHLSANCLCELFYNDKMCHAMSLFEPEHTQ